MFILDRRSLKEVRPRENKSCQRQISSRRVKTQTVSFPSKDENSLMNSTGSFILGASFKPFNFAASNNEEEIPTTIQRSFPPRK